jgi:hypothetical protein
VAISAIAHSSRRAPAASQPTPAPASATEKPTAPSLPSPSPAPVARPSVQPALPGSIPLDQVKLPPTTSPTPWAVPPPPTESTTTKRPPQPPASRRTNTKQPTTRSKAPAPAPSVSSTTAPTACQGPLVVIEQPDGTQDHANLPLARRFGDLPTGQLTRNSPYQVTEARWMDFECPRSRCLAVKHGCRGDGARPESIGESSPGSAGSERAVRPREACECHDGP